VHSWSAVNADANPTASDARSHAQIDQRAAAHILLHCAPRHRFSLVAATDSGLQFTPHSA